MRFSLFAAVVLSAVITLASPMQATATNSEVDTDITEVFVSVADTVVAHTAMNNPVQYKLVPEEAAESAKVTVSYRAISSLADEGKEISIPKDMGKYLVFINVEFNDNSFYCAGKYLIYEIAESQGEPLAEDEALRSVPTEFSATVESKSASYSVAYTAPACSLNVASIKPRLMYSHLYANGTTGAYTEQLPSEPGDYITSCFVLDTVVGTGRLIIDKLTPQIIMDDASFVYSKDGYFPPKASVNPNGIELEYKAYLFENGVVGDAVSFPLKNCGTYLISACPADNVHYNFTLSYCYITINKATPIISAESQIYFSDGNPKPLQFSVTPDYVDYTISYYKLIDGVSSAIDAAPSEIGEYYAVVAVKNSPVCTSLTRVYGIKIVEAENFWKKLFSVVLKIVCISVSISAVAFGMYEIRKVKRSKGEHTK